MNCKEAVWKESLIEDRTLRYVQKKIDYDFTRYLWIRNWKNETHV